jgi:hypothetical protein
MALEHQLNNQNTLRDLRYYITYNVLNADNTSTLMPIPITNQNVIETQIVWDITTNFAEGVLFIKDDENVLSNIFVHHSMKIKIEAIDRFGVFFGHAFNIVNITSEMSDLSKSVVRIDFIDSIYYYMSNLFVNKGYNNITFDQVMSDILSGTDKPMLFSTTKTKYENFVIPAHRPFANFLANRENIDGCSFIQGRDYMMLLNAEDLIDGTKVIDYTSDNIPKDSKIIFRDAQSDNDLIPYQIKSIKKAYLDAFNYNSVLPTIVEHKFDYTKKTVNRTEDVKYNNINNFKQNLVDYKTTILHGAIGNTGYKIREVKNFEQNNKFYSFKLLQNSMYEITTDGTFNLDIMSIVGLVVTLKQRHNSVIDKVSSGHYYITKIVDKFQGNNFNQIVTLGRSGYMYGAK